MRRCEKCMTLIEEPGSQLPYEPPHLRDLIDNLDYKKGWTMCFHLFKEDGQVRGWMFYPTNLEEDSMKPDHMRRTGHVFLVPPASWNADTWTAWLFDMLGKVDDHERGEFFKVYGKRVFAPHHGNGEDPYRVYQLGTEEAASKSPGDE